MIGEWARRKNGGGESLKEARARNGTSTEGLGEQQGGRAGGRFGEKPFSDAERNKPANVAEIEQDQTEQRRAGNRCNSKVCYLANTAGRAVVPGRVRVRRHLQQKKQGNQSQSEGYRNDQPATGPAQCCQVMGCGEQNQKTPNPKTLQTNFDTYTLAFH